MKLVKTATQEHSKKSLLAAQVYIQNQLDCDLSLKQLAKEIALSPSYFHQLFKSQLGETVKAYVDRLRVEKSLYDIRISDLNLLQIALRYGFKNPETYSRVFKKIIGKSPSYFLKERKLMRPKKIRQSKPVDLKLGLRYSTDSAVSVTKLSDLQLAFIRHWGPYEAVPLISSTGDHLWRRLERFVQENQLVAAPYKYIGMGLDSPGTTAAEKCRFDCCILVDKTVEASGDIAFQKIEAGYFAVLTHAGPYHSLIDSYIKLFQSAGQLKGYTIAAAPVIELLIDINAKTSNDNTWTELYLPLNRIV